MKYRSTTKGHRTPIAVLMIALGMFTAACGGSPDGVEAADHGSEAEAPRPAGATTLAPGDEIPAPSDEVVLTVSGLVNAGTGTPVELDLATIDRFGLQTFSVYEPFVEQDLTFQGVDLRDLVDVMEPDDNATEIHLVALDDYIVDLTIADVRSGGTMLATHHGDGSPIAIQDGGPIRIVFLDGADAGPTPNEWIWSLAAAEVR